MKQIVLVIGLAISLSACASTPEPLPAPVAKPAPVTQPAPPPAVDCTGLSEAECQHQIQHFGNPNPPPMRGPLDLDPVPVEPVDVEPLGSVITPNP